jgi:peptidoglycan/xylan/chitin deacetylase (PgdA/CDA1 family)
MKHLLVPLLILLTLPVPALAAADPAPPPAASRGTIALTFDDVPHGDGAFFTGAERTERLVAALDAAGVEGAMFFVLGRNAEGQAGGRARLEAYAAAGHALANHSYSHTALRQTDAGDYLADIDRASRTLEGLPGALPYFRFPFLDEGRDEARRDAVRNGLDARSLRNGYVTVDNYDWYMDSLAGNAVEAGRPVDMEALRRAYVDILLEGVEFYDGVAREVLGRSPAHVLLLHENDLAALFVGDLVAALRAAGWTVVAADTAYRDEIAAERPDTLFNGQGRVAAIAHARGARSARELVPPFEEEAWIEAEFARRGVFPAQ